MKTLLQWLKIGWKYVLVAVVIVAIAGYFFSGQGSSLGASLTVSQGDFAQQVSVSGTVTAAKDVDLGFAANGRVAGVYATVGQHIASGAVLAEIENGDLVAAVAQKQAALEKVQAELASLLSGSTAEQVAVASTTLTNAEASLENSIQSAYTTADDAVHNKIDIFFTNPRTQPRITFAVTNATLKNAVETDRLALESMFVAWTKQITTLSSATASDEAIAAQKNLAQVVSLLADANAALNQSVPDQTTTAAVLASYATTLGTARSNVNAATASLTSALSALAAAQRNFSLVTAGPTPDVLSAKRATVASAQADVENAQAALNKTRVLAPFSGVVTRMDAKTGEIVSPTTADISMQSDGLFQIETYVPEVTIAGVAVGNRATTTLDAYGTGVSFAAKVIAVDPAETIKDGVPTYKTTLTFLAPDARIRSGMTANVVISIGTLHNAVVIPQGAVATDANGPYVSVLVGKTVEHRSITLGPSPALGQVQIASGLSAGDVILLSP